MRLTRREAAPGLWAFWASARDVAGEEWRELYAQMSPERQTKCMRYRREEDKARCILADALARRAVADLAGIAPRDVAFAQGPGGKPYAPGLGVGFSLSHSGSLALCAAAAFPVGADVQKVRPVSDGLLRRAARAGYAGSSREDFFRWWVRQEAAGKLSGRGLVLSALPAGLAFRDGTRTEDGTRYFYSICAGEAFLPGGNVL